MIIKGGTTDVTTYFVLRSSTDGTELTGATITSIDLQYVRTGAAPSAKVDATALAATDSAHADNKAIEIDGTDAPGLYRVDWPDAAFAAGVLEVLLSVKYTGAFTEHLRVTIDPIGAPAGASISADIAAVKVDTAAILVDTGTTLDGKIDTIDTNVDSILVDTAEIGAAGAGLTNINLPNQTMDIVGSITGNLSGSVGSVTGAVGSVTGAVGSVAGNVDGNVTGTVGSLAAQAKADVNAEVLDVLNVDTFAEPGQGTPSATTTLVAKLGYLFKNWRNKKTQTATEWALYNDDTTTKGQESVVSDDGTTATKGEISTGA